jgi:hypothetical protein
MPRRLKPVPSGGGRPAEELSVDAEEDDVDDIPCTTDRPHLIPAGDYEVGYVRAEKKAHLWGGREKLFIHFKITQPGEHLGKVLFMSVNLPVNGRFSISSKYLQQWSLAAGKQPKRHDRLSTRVFRGKVFLAQVRTVTISAHSSGKIQKRDSASFYSVVDHLLEVVAGA